jgi:hypothetical protein
MLIVTAFVVLQASPAHATIDRIYGPPGELCTVSAPCNNSFPYPIRQGHSPTIDVEGQFVDLSTGLEISGSGVTVSTVGTSSSNRQIRVSVSADAAPGPRTIKLHYAVELNGPDHFLITVLRAGVVTSVTAPVQTQYFNDVNITLHGQKLDNLGVLVLPTTIGTFSVGGSQLPQVVTLTQTDATASVVTQSATAPVIGVNFIGGPFAEAKATILVFDKQITADTCKLHRVFCHAGIDSDQVGGDTFRVIGPNAVSSITFPITNTVGPGSLLTIKITLVRPAKSGGETIRWQVLPSDSFAAVAGSGTQFSPTGNTSTGDNSVIIPQGDQSKELTVQYQQVPAGCGRSGCSGQVRTRMVNFNVDQLPFLRLATFTMLSR